jgi:hypothetical protein
MKWSIKLYAVQNRHNLNEARMAMKVAKSKQNHDGRWGVHARGAQLPQPGGHG